MDEKDIIKKKKFENISKWYDKKKITYMMYEIMKKKEKKKKKKFI